MKKEERSDEQRKEPKEQELARTKKKSQLVTRLSHVSLSALLINYTQAEGWKELKLT